MNDQMTELGPVSEETKGQGNDSAEEPSGKFGS